MIPCLPHEDSPERQRERQQQLERAREEYRYTYVPVGPGGSAPPLPMVDSLPWDENFSPEYLVRVAWMGLHLVGNSLLLEARGLLPGNPRLHALDTQRPQLAAPSLAPDQLLEQQRSLMHELNELPPLPAEHLEQYEQLAPLLPPLSVARTFHQDETFARARTLGANPLAIRRVDAVPEHLAVTEALFQRVLGDGDTLAAAAAERRMFLADYSLLEGLELGSTPDGRRKYLCAPLALFCWQRQPARLVPVAIQLGPRPPAPVFTPLDGTAWLVARTFVQVADGNVHEMVSHLGRTHLVLESFAVSTARQLAPSHPVAVLLRPHLRFTLAINSAARRFLIAPRGGVDRLLAGTLEASLSLASRARSAPFWEQALPRELAARGLDDAEVLPDYPFREDARLLWQALQDFVGAYVRLYYGSDAEVVRDEELQAWARELQAQEGGRMQGLTASGTLEGVEALTGVLVQVLFTAGPLHAAVNFTQYPCMGYAPNQPLAAYCPPPRDTRSLSPEALLRWLPPLDQAYRQLSLLYVLSSVREGEFGRYDFEDERAQELANRFQRRLRAIESTIDERNQQRAVPYTLLKPSCIPISTNI